MDSPRILLVEDDPNVCRILEIWLIRQKYQVWSVATEDEALRCIEQEKFDILITDLQLKVGEGTAVLSAAHLADPEMKLIILTGAASIDSAIKAIDCKVSAYLCKPITGEELVRTVERALQEQRERREKHQALHQIGKQLMQFADATTLNLNETPLPSSDLLRVGHLQIDMARRCAIIANQKFALSPGEFQILVYLAQGCGKVIPAYELARELQIKCSPQEASELIKARMHRLRQKIESDPSLPRILICVRGAGYMLSAE